MQLHRRSGRVRRPQVGRPHTQLARSTREGDEAPALGALVPATPPGEPVQRDGRERVQLHERTARVEFGDELGCHLVPVCV